MDSPFAPGDRSLRLAARFGLAGDGALLYGRLALLLIAIAWLPLLVLSLAAGTAYGNPPVIPFLGDFLANGRYLIALPLLVLLHPMVDRRIGIFLGTLGRSGLVAPGDDAMLQRHLDRAGALWHSRLVRLVLLAASVVLSVALLQATTLMTVSSWAIGDAQDGGGLSRAGWWTIVVGGSIVRFLLLLAAWKLLLWYGFLFRLARTPLRYEPLHPDRSAGLGLLDWVQCGFGAMVAALAVQFGCLMADSVAYKGMELLGFRMPAIAFVVLMLVLLFVPLLAFMLPLARACDRTESVFQVWAHRAAQHLGARLQDSGKETVASHLSSPETSSLTDATSLYEATARTRRIPISMRALKFALVVTLLPMVVPLLPLLPLKELALRLVKIVM